MEAYSGCHTEEMQYLIDQVHTEYKHFMIFLTVNSNLTCNVIVTRQLYSAITY